MNRDIRGLNEVMFVYADLMLLAVICITIKFQNKRELKKEHFELKSKCQCKRLVH